MTDREILTEKVRKLVEAYVADHCEGANATLSFSNTVELTRIDVPFTGENHDRS